MRILKTFSIIIALTLLCMLCSCAKEGSNQMGKISQKEGIDQVVETSQSDKSLIELASRIYNESQLSEIVKFNGSISELNTQYPIECLRKNSGTYRVSYLGDTSIAVLLFDESGNKLLGNIYHVNLSKSDFSELLKGQLLEDVRAIDPNGEYLFLFTGRNDTPRVSSHYTKDGYLITVEYDASNRITDIIEELI